LKSEAIVILTSLFTFSQYVLGKTSEKEIHMNIITSLLYIEDNDLELLSYEVQG